ncbi:MAG: tRNA glutamyl-Q(34) synthetase GluQRS [Oscillospiraceae bacterium]|nr:tRNA glutamyl-Q(34) synthetase GluQRS [Oscillospiraceae bacterium]
MEKEKLPLVGRFAPTPSGRMHLGNVFAALLAWLSVRSRDGELVLRMEDLDTQRTSPEFAQILREDLTWLGLTWDRETPAQSTRSAVYDACFERLAGMDLIYPCYCTRSQLHSVNAPHLSDGTYIYPGTCRELTQAQREGFSRKPAWRLQVPDREYALEDKCCGSFRQNLSRECGDFLVRRADGVYMYQLAVVVDDGLSGVTEVVRGRDLLESAPRQMYLQELLGFQKPQYAHVPMLLSADGRRLSKRDKDLDLGQLRTWMKPEQLLGWLAYAAGLLDKIDGVSARELAKDFTWEHVKKEDIFADTRCFYR